MPENSEEKTLSKGEQTRSAIIEAAYALFLERGYHGTSMRQVAERAELALGGIYNYFASKEEIFAAVLDAYHPYHAILPALETTQGETVEAFVRDAARRVRAGITGVETRLLPLLFIELVEFQGRHLAQLAQRVLPTVLPIIQRFGERRGKLRPLPLPVVFRAFMGLMIGFLMSEMILKETPLLKQTNYDWFGGMVDIYLHGILEQGD